MEPSAASWRQHLLICIETNRFYFPDNFGCLGYTVNRSGSGNCVYDTPVVNLVQATEYKTGDRVPRAQHYEMSRVPVFLIHSSCGIDNVIFLKISRPDSLDVFNIFFVSFINLGRNIDKFV